jgi:CxxC motif-containing protein (DUF1111 family)
MKWIVPQRWIVLGTILVAFSVAAGCDSPGATSAANELDAVELGGPLPGLTPEQRARFEQGHALFRRIFTPEEGLGPLFNENACNACHTDPADGGTGDQLIIRATHYTPETGCDLLLDEGGDNLRQQVTPALRAHGIEGDEIPERANAVGRVDVPFLFGLGLVEAIPEETILAREDPNDERGDGITGRAARTPDGRVARFGRKGHITTLFDFNEEALRLEMGLTTPIHPEELGPNRGPLPEGVDPAENPEVDMETIQLLTDFVRFLAPLPRSIPDDPAIRAQIEQGEEIFEAIGCTSCHTPYMETGPNEVEALDRKRVYLYSDLLLHDMGESLADVCGPDAGPSEVRTEMLMGLQHRDLFLHDGRAGSVEEAIEMHGGEAAPARDRFMQLNFGQRAALIRFLDSL